MALNSRTRHQIAQVLAWADAHATFEDAVAGLPQRLRGIAPDGFPHSPWQLVEHMRLAQADILEFCVAKRYKEKQFPKDYWPASPKPPSARAWDESIARFKRDRRKLERLALDARRDLLARVPNGTGQTFLREILLVADHNAYHIGQLIAVRRLLGHWPAR